MKTTIHPNWSTRCFMPRTSTTGCRVGEGDPGGQYLRFQPHGRHGAPPVAVRQRLGAGHQHHRRPGPTLEIDCESTQDAQRLSACQIGVLDGEQDRPRLARPLQQIQHRAVALLGSQLQIAAEQLCELIVLHDYNR